MAQLSNDFHEGNTAARQVEREDLPFDICAFERKYGAFRSAERLCPGIYKIETGPVPPWRAGAECIVVMRDTPAISETAKGYGTPLGEVPEILMYPLEDYFNKARWVVIYEIHKYLVDHGLPLPEGKTLEEDRERGMEVCPEYFGEYPVPTKTPWGPVLRSDRLWNGLYWLETAEVGWVLALAFPLFEDVREKTASLAVADPSGSEGGKNSDFAYHFYQYEYSCLPIYELLSYAENTWAKQINMAALKNAIVESFPAYVQEDEEEYADFPIGDRIFYTDGAGTDFYKFPGVDKP